MQSELGSPRTTIGTFLAGEESQQVSYYPAAWELALLSGGVEISGNGYARYVIPTGAFTIAGWSKSGTTVTVTLDTLNKHGLLVGDVVNVEGCNNLTSVPDGPYTITAVTSNTFAFTASAGGAAGGAPTDQLYYTPDMGLFWDRTLDADGYAILTQARAIEWATAATGGEWTFDELRFIEPDSGGDFWFKFVGETTTRIADGDSVMITTGTLTVTDISGSET